MFCIQIFYFFIFLISFTKADEDKSYFQVQKEDFFKVPRTKDCYKLSYVHFKDQIHKVSICEIYSRYHELHIQQSNDLGKSWGKEIPIEKTVINSKDTEYFVFTTKDKMVIVHCGNLGGDNHHKCKVTSTNDGISFKEEESLDADIPKRRRSFSISGYNSQSIQIGNKEYFYLCGALRPNGDKEKDKDKEQVFMLCFRTETETLKWKREHPFLTKWDHESALLQRCKLRVKENHFIAICLHTALLINSYGTKILNCELANRTRTRKEKEKTISEVVQVFVCEDYNLLKENKDTNGLLSGTNEGSMANLYDTLIKKYNNTSDPKEKYAVKDIFTGDILELDTKYSIVVQRARPINNFCILRYNDNKIIVVTQDTVGKTGIEYSCYYPQLLKIDNSRMLFGFSDKHLHYYLYLLKFSEQEYKKLN